MDHMDELRKRRQQRIQHIMNGETDPNPRGRGRPEWYAELEHERLLREDPEYQWKYKYNSERWRPASPGGPRLIRLQAALSAVAFAAVWAVFQWNHPAAAQAQSFVRSALSEDMRFDDAYAWVQERIGGIPTFLPALERAPAEAATAQAGVSRTYITPVTGTVAEPFGGLHSGAGVVVRATSGAVVSMDTGLVVFAGETLETGQTVVVRHPNGVETVYGYLGEIVVAKDEWVEAGAAVGHARPAESGENGSLVYFAVKKGNSFVDPTDVVAF